MTSRKHSSSSSTDPPVRREVVLGVDTHGEVHVAAVMSALGKILGTESFPATAAGYRHLLVWARKRGTVRRAGVEGTGRRRASTHPAKSHQKRPRDYEWKSFRTSHSRAEADPAYAAARFRRSASRSRPLANLRWARPCRA